MDCLITVTYKYVSTIRFSLSQTRSLHKNHLQDIKIVVWIGPSDVYLLDVFEEKRSKFLIAFAVAARTPAFLNGDDGQYDREGDMNGKHWWAYDRK